MAVAATRPQRSWLLARALVGAAGAALVCVLSGCDATLAVPLATHVVNDPTSTHVGALTEGRVHLPRSYDWTVGVEGGHLVQAEPKAPVGQWRVGVTGGHNPLLRPVGGRAALDLSARVGAFGGANGPITNVGPYAGVAVAVPIRVSCTQEPWELDDLVYGSWSLVPQIGTNALVPELHFRKTALEIAASFAVRITFSSTLMP
jgi:hypothetical protein